jgi:hypothetical protein
VVRPVSEAVTAVVPVSAVRTLKPPAPFSYNDRPK